MSFLHAERLWLLLGVVGLAAGYAWMWQRRSRAAALYVSPHLHDRIAPTRRGAVRHLAPLLAMVAVALLLVSVAQPTRPERVPREKGIVVLTVDTSLSMTATDIAPTRLQAAIDGARSFIDDLPDGIEVGLVSFDSDARLLVSPTTDHASVQAAIGGLTTDSRTATGEGVFESLEAVEAAVADDGSDVPAAIVLLSDGTETVGRSIASAAAAATEAEVPVSTIAYGTPTGTVTIDGEVIGVPADTATMSAVANQTGGTYFEATTAGELQAVYADIQTTIGYETVPVEVGRALVGAAFVLMLIAGAVAVATSDRPL